MENEEKNSSINVSSMEMIAMAGFGLCTAWMLICFYWLFCEFPPGAPTPTRDFAQLFIFLAVPIGYVAIHFMAKNPSFNLFAMPMKVGATIFAVVQPIIALLMYQGVYMPVAVVCVANVLVGMASASITLAWLDICSRLGAISFGRFTGLSLFNMSRTLSRGKVGPDPK